MAAIQGATEGNGAAGLMRLAGVAHRVPASPTVTPAGEQGGEWLAPLRKDGLEAIFYEPGVVEPSRPPLVLVHGISRNARAHIRAFIPLADKLGIRLLAPIFPRLGHKSYQRPGTRSAHSEPALLQLLEDVRRHGGGDFSRVDMFGFSAGAQFAHRFALLRPHRIRRLLLASSGWYTFPSLRYRYPYGIGANGVVDPRFDLDGFLDLSIKVVVGQFDVTRGPVLRTKGDIDQMQGPNRLMRAGNWSRAVSTMMAARGAAGDVQFEILPNCGHSFDDCVTVGGLRNVAMAWYEHRRK